MSNASLAIGPTTKAMKFAGMLDGDSVDDLYCEACIAFTSLLITNSEGVVLSLDEFDQLGIDYWDAFAKGRPEK